MRPYKNFGALICSTAMLLCLLVFISCNSESDSTDGDVVQTDCTPMDRRCASSDAVEICNEEGKGWSLYRQCEDGKICCLGSCVNGESCDDIQNDGDIGGDRDAVADGDNNRDGDIDTQDADLTEDSDNQPDGDFIDSDISENDVDLTEDTDGDTDFSEDDLDYAETETMEYEAPDWPWCPKDQYWPNHIWQYAYPLESESQTIDDMMLCGGVFEFFKMDLEADEYLTITSAYYEEDETVFAQLFYEDEGVSTTQDVAYSSIIDDSIWKLAYHCNEAGMYYIMYYREYNLLTEVTYTTGNDYEIQGNDCSDPIVLDLESSGLQKHVFPETFNLMSNDMQGSCAGEEGKDMVFRFDLAEETEIWVVVDTFDVDVGIYIRTVCEDGESQIICKNNSYGQEEIPYVLPAGTYYLVVDAVYGHSDGEIYISIYL